MLSPNQQVRRLSKKFGIQVTHMHIIQDGVYRVTTRQGKSYCLKRMPYPPSRIRWVDTTINRIRKQHKRIRIGWRNPKLRSGKKRFVRLRCQDCPPFVLVPWIRGTWPSPHSIQQMKACGMLLARFHQAGHQIQIPTAGQHRTVGTWIAYYQAELRTLQAAIRKAAKNKFRSPLDSMLKKHGQEILRMGKRSLYALKTSGYRRACQQSKLTLCHGDFGPTNLIRTSKGMYMIDFETLRMDLRAYDLYKSIFNFCQRNHWNFATAKAFLDGYQKVTRLNRLDFKLLRSLLRFPRGISKLIQNYSIKSSKEKWKIERDFPTILAHERNRNDFLRRLDSYAGAALR